MLVRRHCRGGASKFITHIHLLRSARRPARSLLTKSQPVLIHYVEIDAGIKASSNANLYLIAQRAHTQTHTHNSYLMTDANISKH